MQRFVHQARRLTPALQSSRGYASQATKSAGEQVPGETFATSAWKKTAIVVAIGAVWYNVDQSISNAGNKNIITKWVETAMTSSEENDKINASFYNHSQTLADYRLIYQDAQRAPVYRMRYPESFERCSPRALTAGAQADLSDVKIRSD
ncbi:uncharacterized protein BX664DRAFT_323486 [Halteromyces radiatus]|uniref:uncharacterized protein n=1 Tax=Halteromyces radiatus TaxID=101107 RepID=UPI002220B9E1|nr:uncharacterized protein BX664DRAFT_323486 [Halteromyces radiatus]KAI8096260.1 hypothetical protein BX664DRAFT_323486 [Halteromyces radiatus]